MEQPASTYLDARTSPSSPNRSASASAVEVMAVRRCFCAPLRSWTRTNGTPFYTSIEVARLLSFFALPLTSLTDLDLRLVVAKEKCVGQL
jgi:hypothetical protein